MEKAPFERKKTRIKEGEIMDERWNTSQAQGWQWASRKMGKWAGRLRN
jgi:hypothetical protein